MELAAISHDCILQSTCVCIVQHPLLAMGGPLHYIQIGFGTPSLFGYCNYSRVRNKRTPLNKHSPWNIWQKQ